MSVRGTGLRLFGVLAVNGTAQSKYTLTQAHKRRELAPSMGWNKTVSSEEKRGEDACGADWYSLQLIFVDAGFVPRTAKREAGESLIVIGDADPTPPLPHPTCTPQLPDWPLCPQQF